MFLQTDMTVDVKRKKNKKKKLDMAMSNNESESFNKLAQGSQYEP